MGWCPVCPLTCPAPTSRLAPFVGQHLKVDLGPPLYTHEMGGTVWVWIRSIPYVNRGRALASRPDAIRLGINGICRLRQGTGKVHQNERTNVGRAERPAAAAAGQRSHPHRPQVGLPSNMRFYYYYYYFFVCPVIFMWQSLFGVTSVFILQSPFQEYWQCGTGQACGLSVWQHLSAGNSVRLSFEQIFDFPIIDTLIEMY